MNDRNTLFKFVLNLLKMLSQINHSFLFGTHTLGISTLPQWNFYANKVSQHAIFLFFSEKNRNLSSTFVEFGNRKMFEIDSLISNDDFQRRKISGVYPFGRNYVLVFGLIYFNQERFYCYVESSRM